MTWAALTVASALVHRKVWGRETSPEEASLPLQIASNLLHMATAPAWLIMRAATGRWGSTSLSYLLFADGLGWMFWGLGAAVVLRARDDLLRLWIRRAAARAGSSDAPASLARRKFLVDSTLVVAGAGATALAVRSAAVDPWRLVVRSYRVPIAGLPPSLEGLRLVQLSDTHLGPRVPASFIR